MTAEAAISGAPALSVKAPAGRPERVADDLGHGYEVIRAMPFLRLSIHPSRDEAHTHEFVRGVEADDARASRA